MCTVVEFCKEEGMWLLPRQKRMNFMRPFTPVRPRALGPARSAAPLFMSRLAGRLKKLLIDADAAIELGLSVPQCVVRAMPPVHFKVESTIPTVVDQAALLWGKRTGFIDSHEVLRQHDPAF